MESWSRIYTLPKRKEANNDYDNSYEEDAFTSTKTHSRTLQEMKHYQTFSVYFELVSKGHFGSLDSKSDTENILKRISSLQPLTDTFSDRTNHLLYNIIISLSEDNIQPPLSSSNLLKNRCNVSESSYCLRASQTKSFGHSLSNTRSLEYDNFGLWELLASRFESAQPGIRPHDSAMETSATHYRATLFPGRRDLYRYRCHQRQ